MDKNKSKTKYWQSLEQWKQDPAFNEMAEKEFQTSPLDEEAQGGWARRDFLKLMGASLALGSFGCVRRPIQKIVPYVKRPEEVVPGVSNFYASSLNDSGTVYGLVVRTREGRPVKLEGNEFFPEVGEALSARGHAHLLNLYDPERLKGPVKNLLNPKRTNSDVTSTTWDKVDADLTEQFKKGGVYVLTGPNPSETSRNLIDSFVGSFGGETFRWSPRSYEKFKKSFSVLGGESESLPRLRPSKAKYIFSLGTDLLDTEYGALQFSREWGEARNPEKGEPVKLVQVESMMTLTGSNSDERYIVKPSDYLSFLCAVIKFGGFSGDYAQRAASYPGVKNLDKEILEAAKKVAQELNKNRQKSLVVAFGVQSEGVDYEEIQKAAHFLNASLENDGRTIDYSQSPYVSYNASSSSIETLIEKMNEGAVKTLLIHDTNPLYTYYDREKLSSALSKVSKVVYTGDRADETGRVSHYILPDDHALEKWNEFESMKGVYTISQPTIRPLYETRAFEQSLLKWMGRSETWFDLVKETWKSRFAANSSGISSFDKFWTEVLQKGVWDLTGFKNSVKGARNFKGSFDAKYKEAKGLELVLYPSSAFGEGKLANVSWLQEMPDPITKIVWDNYFNVSMAFAEEHHLKDGDVISVEVEGRKVELPAHIQPGHDDQSLSVSLGYGRKGAGKVSKDIGKNAYPLSSGGNFAVQGVKFSKTLKFIKLASVQNQSSLEGRNLVVEASYDEYKKDHSAGIHKHKIFSLWSKHKYTGHKWAMSVDLSKCTGCSACVVACQSENNIPVVGKTHILSGRQMHWIRIDRYYAGTPKNPRTLYQPVMCHHCDNAPCETVCPVLATVHSSEGLNDMAYNRCVGTRYCANNCPYKVRRFNWFNYSKIKSPLNMALNPEVTVRARGVMEKCSFCVQRINDGKTKAVLEKRKLRDGDIKPACEQTCPTKAFVFGDMNDKESRVSKLFEKQRTYQMLEELNIVPSVRYMTKIRNTDEQLVAHHGGGHGEEKGHKDSHKDEHKTAPQHEGEAH